jgi:hypothetical protein
MRTEQRIQPLVGLVWHGPLVGIPLAWGIYRTALERGQIFSTELSHEFIPLPSPEQRADQPAVAANMQAQAWRRCCLCCTLVQDRAWGSFLPAVLPSIAEACLTFHVQKCMALSLTTISFAAQPPGKHVMQVCRAEACQACGSEELWDLAWNNYWAAKAMKPAPMACTP